MFCSFRAHVIALTLGFLFFFFFFSFESPLDKGILSLVVFSLFSVPSTGSAMTGHVLGRYTLL